MFPKGTIYDYRKGLTRGVFILQAPFTTRVAYAFARGVGIGLIGFVVITFLFLYGPMVREEARYVARNTFTSGSLEPEKALTTRDFVDEAEAFSAEAVQKEAESYGVNSSFSLVIPKIEAYSNVIANVDTADEVAYEAALKKGVAHAAGTYFPGQGEQIYMFSHSTDASFNVSRYNAVFYLLRKLEPGDGIITFFADKKYEYKVTEKVVIPADDTSWYTNPKPGEHLVLQTCDPPGTSWKRLLVIAEPVN